MSTLIGRIRDLCLSGWSFSFRWPTINNERFIPSGILLVPFFQVLVVGLIGVILELFSVEGDRKYLFFAILATSALTGFLHEDGLADTADSLGVSGMCGSEAGRERVRAALKDSRLGTFGVTALALLWGARAYGIGTGECNVGHLVAIYALSRGLGIGVGILESKRWISNSVSRSSAILSDISPRGVIAMWLVSLIIVGFVGYFEHWLLVLSLVRFGAVILGIFAASVFLLRWLSGRSGAFVGDYAGCICCLVEITLLLFVF